MGHATSPFKKVYFVEGYIFVGQPGFDAEKIQRLRRTLPGDEGFRLHSQRLSGLMKCACWIDRPIWPGHGLHVFRMRLEIRDAKRGGNDKIIAGTQILSSCRNSFRVARPTKTYI